MRIWQLTLSMAFPLIVFGPVGQSVADAQDRASQSRSFSRTAQPPPDNTRNVDRTQTRSQDAALSAQSQREQRCDRILQEAYQRGARELTLELETQTRGCSNAGWVYYFEAMTNFSRIRLSDGISDLERLDLEKVHGDVAIAIKRGIPDPENLQGKVNTALSGGAIETAIDQRLAARFAQYSGNPSTPEARALFERAKQEGGDAAMVYARTIANGEGATVDNKAVVFWLKRASSDNHAKAQAYLAAYIFHGRGIAPDHSQAYYWADRSARDGNPMGLYWRAALSWPASNPELFMEMLRDQGPLVGIFNARKAYEDFGKTIEVCKTAPFNSDPDYDMVCKDAPRVRVILFNRGDSTNPDEQYWLDYNQRMADQIHQERLAEDNRILTLAVGMNFI